MSRPYNSSDGLSNGPAGGCGAVANRGYGPAGPLTTRPERPWGGAERHQEYAALRMGYRPYAVLLGGGASHRRAPGEEAPSPGPRRARPPGEFGRPDARAAIRPRQRRVSVRQRLLLEADRLRRRSGCVRRRIRGGVARPRQLRPVDEERV